MTRTPPQPSPLATLLARIRRRTRWLALLAGLALYLSAATLVLGIAGLTLGQATPEALRDLGWVTPLSFSLLALLGLVVAGFVYWRAFHGNQRAERLALSLERSHPDTAGLVSAIEFERAVEDPDLLQAYSTPLARAHIQAVEKRLESLDPKQAVTGRSTLQAGGLALASLGLGLIVTLLPGSPIPRGLERLGSGRAEIALLDAEAVKSSPALITGDVTLTYRFPAYTRRSPRTVEGTGGEIRALPGTEVEIQTTADREVKAAELQVGDAHYPLQVQQGHKLSGKLIVRESGSYQFRFLDALGKLVVEGSPHLIALESDAWPKLTIKLLGHEEDGPGDRIEVTRDEVLGISWEASDDFGLGELNLVWDRKGTKQERLILGSLENQSTGAGMKRWQLASLALSPGEKLSLHLEIGDNDAVGGPKLGRSRSITLEVFSKVAHHRALIDSVNALWKQLITHLADQLEGPFAPQDKVKDRDLTAELARMGGLDTSLAALVQQLRKLRDQLLEDALGDAALVRALANLSGGLDAERRRLEISLRSLTLRMGLPPPRRAAMIRLIKRNQDRIVSEIEKDILYLEDLLDRERVRAMQEIARDLKDSKRQLEQLIDQLRQSPSEALRRKISDEISRLKQRMFELMKRMQEMARSIRDEHLNQEAMEDLRKNEDLMGHLDSLQRLINEGKLEEALSQLDAMSKQLDQMLENFNKGEQSLGDDKYRELSLQVNAVRDELQRVSHDQEALLKQSRTLRARYQAQLQKRIKGRLDALARRLAKLAAAARDELRKLPEASKKLAVGLYDREILDRTARGLDDLKMLLEAKDFDEALKAGHETLRQAAALQGLFQDAERSTRRLGRDRGFLGLSPEALRQAVEEGRRRVEAAHEITRSLVEELEKLFPDPREVFDKAQQQHMQSMAKRQEALRQRAQKLASKMQSLGQKAPLFSPGMGASLRQAQRHMGDAASRLQSSDARRAASEERAALDRLGEVSKQMEEAQKQGGPGGMPIPMGAGEPSGSSARGRRQLPVEIPDANAYKAPEAFRKELLEAMKDSAPRRYKEQVKRYYEELVK